MSMDIGFRELKRPRYYPMHTRPVDRFPRKVGVAVMLGVVVVSIGLWWAAKV